MAANESGEEDEADDSEMKDLAPDETDEQMEVDEQEVKEKLKVSRKIPLRLSDSCNSRIGIQE